MWTHWEGGGGRGEEGERRMDRKIKGSNEVGSDEEGKEGVGRREMEGGTKGKVKGRGRVAGGEVEG